MKVKIKVKKKHIKASKGSTRHCPIDRALKKVFLKEVTATTSLAYIFIYVSSDEMSEPLELPAKAREFILAHDTNWKKAKPFSFKLNIPKYLLRK